MAWKTPVPTAAILSCATTGSVASGSSLPSGSFFVATPSQSSRLATAGAGSVPFTGAAKSAGDMGAIDAASHVSFGAAADSMPSRSVYACFARSCVVNGARPTTVAPSFASAPDSSDVTFAYACA